MENDSWRPENADEQECSFGKADSEQHLASFVMNATVGP